MIENKFKVGDIVVIARHEGIDKVNGKFRRCPEFYSLNKPFEIIKMYKYEKTEADYFLKDATDTFVSSECLLELYEPPQETAKQEQIESKFKVGDIVVIARHEGVDRISGYIRRVPFKTPLNEPYEIKNIDLFSNYEAEYRLANSDEELAWVSECLLELYEPLQEITKQEQSDKINHPDHYKWGGIETIDYMEAKLTSEEFLGYLKASIIKYTSRAGKKLDEIEDYKKARWYLERLIKKLEG
jgi:hypothetical protein